MGRARGWKLRLLGLGAMTLVCLAAWLLPGPKPRAVLGRFNYAQFLAALAAAGGLLSAVCLTLARPGRGRAAAFRVAAVWLGGTAALLACEGVAFLLPPRAAMDNPWYLSTGQGVQAGDDLPFERPPHLHWEGLSRGDLAVRNGDDDPYARRITFATDWQGFRNGQDLAQADVVFLGDSYTEAGNLPEEEGYVQRVARDLGRTARNLGRAGYTGPTELLVLKKYGLACRPRVVVWQLAEANDLNEALNYQQWVAAGRPPYLRTEAAGQPSRRESWQGRSPTYRLFAGLRSPAPWPLGGTFRDPAGRSHEVRFLTWPDRQHSPVRHPGWPVLADSLREGRRLLREQKVPLVVLLIPMKIRVLGPVVQWSDRARKELRPDWDLPEPATLAAHLAALCAELDVPFVDATPALRQSAREGRLVYLPLDTHLSPEGHQVVSERLREALGPITRTGAPARRSQEERRAGNPGE